MIDLNRVIGIDEIHADYRAWTTKEFFNYRRTKLGFIEVEHWKYTELVENIKNGKVAVFPISTDVSMEEVVNTNKLGLQVYLLQYKKWKELKEKYIADAVEVQEETEQ